MSELTSCNAHKKERAPGVLAIVAKILTDEEIKFRPVAMPSGFGLEVVVGKPSGFVYLVHWLACGESIEVQVSLPFREITAAGTLVTENKIERLHRKYKGELLYHFQQTPWACHYLARVFLRRVLVDTDTSIYEQVRRYFPVIEELGRHLALFADGLQVETALEYREPPNATIN